MTIPLRTARRAERLRSEARNCLKIAVADKSARDTALLIDEAVRLTQRANQLSNMSSTTR